MYIILPESNGAIDLNTEDWTQDAIDAVYVEIAGFPYQLCYMLSTKTIQKLPTQFMTFLAIQKQPEINICQKISRYKPIVEGSEHGVELVLGSIWICLYLG